MAAAKTFKCACCYERDENLEEPKLLPCGHVECTKCLHKSLKIYGKFKCAKCFCTVNSRLSDLPSATRGTSKGRHELCDNCYDQPAISYCEHRSCKKFLCRRHKESHRTIHPDHRTVSLQVQELHSQPQKHSKRSCPLHDDTTVVSGCKRCREVFCQECDLSSGCGGHPHKEIGLKDLAKEVKNDISLLKAKAERRKSELDELFREADRTC
ncbi:transcription intermediary factor 1-beta-like [Watersipora subatra]|uniref:transcription intermediary factor 1-beta-like n=1 Tax=Watersipora subatra TaxID=2589382 RepID=UPI00355B93A8